MKIEVLVNSKQITADDVLSTIGNIVDYVLKTLLPVVLIISLLYGVFYLALGISLLIFLAALILPDNAMIRILGICLSIILAYCSCTKLYPKICSILGAP